MAAPLRYWDSVTFLGWLANEPDKLDACRGVIRAAERGELRIVTSALTLTEVIKLKSKTPLPQEKEPLIKGFFQQSYIVIREVDRQVAEYARELIWAHGFQAKDSIHVATAVLSRVPHLDTFDKQLIGQSGMIGDPPLIIGHPDIPEQLGLDELIGDLADEMLRDDRPNESP